MKKQFRLVIAALLMAACSNNSYIGNEDNLIPDAKPQPGIVFGALQSAATRADATGADAADRLGNKFVVFGTKHRQAETADETNDAIVFDMFQVEYAAGSAGSTETNTCNWEYAGKTAYKPLAIPQEVRYWDYEATKGYTFYAFSSTDISYPASASDLVSVQKVTTGATRYDKGYSVQTQPGANLDNLYFSDRTDVLPAFYQQPVLLRFRTFASRVRVAFYETVPGYNVQIDRFYYDADASVAASTAPVSTFAQMEDVMDGTPGHDRFAASVQRVTDNPTGNSFTVSYYPDGTNINQAHVTNTTVDYEYSLILGDNLFGAPIGSSSGALTYDYADKHYTTIYPFEASTTPMMLRLDYTLTANDGTGDVIHVRNARVTVPSAFMQWRSNYAYTYIFKISDKTNGTTGGDPTDPDHPGSDPDDDPEGLFPITFDACVVTSQDFGQEWITSIMTNSVSSYSLTSDVANSNEYHVGENIYLVTTNNTTHNILPAAGVGDATGYAQVYAATTTGEEITEAAVWAQLTGTPNDISLTPVTPAPTLVPGVPRPDGSAYVVGTNGALRFTPSAAGKYVYVFCETQYVAPTYEPAGTTFDLMANYYFLSTSGAYYAASGLHVDNYATYQPLLYQQTAPGTPGVYTVKVINVVP